MHTEDLFGNVLPTISFLPENLMSSYGRYGQFGTISLAKTCKKWPLPKIKIFREKTRNFIKNQEISLKNKIFPKCRQIVPTPRGSILQPPRASQVPYKAGKNIVILLSENLMSSYGHYGQFGTISLAKTCKKWPLANMKILR